MRAANSIGEHAALECPSPGPGDALSPAARSATSVRTSPGEPTPQSSRAGPDVDPESDPGLWGEAARRSRLFHGRELRLRCWFVIPMFSFGGFCAGDK
jgi:hypothetical protein